MEVKANLEDGSERYISPWRVEKIEVGRKNFVILTMKDAEQIAVRSFNAVLDFDNYDKPMSGLSYLIKNIQGSSRDGSSL